MTKCPSTTDVAVNCGTRERRVSIQYFSYALYGRVFPFAVCSFQFSCTFHLVQFTVSGKRGRTTFKFSLSLSLSLTHKIAKFVLSSATTNNIYVRAAATATAASGVLKVHVAVSELSNAAALCKVSFFSLPNSMSVAGSILTFTCT